MTERIPLITAERSRQRDAQGINEGIPSLVLMERAALGLCDLLEEKAGPAASVVIVCGPGNNGADGFACARILQERGHKVTCVWHEGSGHVLLQKSICEKRHIPVTDDISVIRHGDWIVDALFGSGLSRPVTGLYACWIDTINAAGKPVLAIDLPSGMHGTTGVHAGAVIHASVTACIDCLKQGACLPASLPVTGEMRTVPIGLLPETGGDTFLIDDALVCGLLEARSDFSYKGTFGKVVLAGGSPAMAGAISMALAACFHSGCGLLTAAVPACLADMVHNRHPEAMLLPLETMDEAGARAVLSAGFTLLGCGNGLGCSQNTAAFVQTLLASDLPVVLDADGISVCDPLWLDRQAPTILTPHVGEFSRLTGLSIEEIVADPIEKARTFSLDHPQVVLVLKHTATYVAANGIVYVLCRPDSRLAKGGSGDVLCGIITGLAASQTPLTAAIGGVWAHNMSAALSRKDPRFFTFEDLIAGLDAAWQALK